MESEKEEAKKKKRKRRSEKEEAKKKKRKRRSEKEWTPAQSTTVKNTLTTFKIQIILTKHYPSGVMTVSRFSVILITKQLEVISPKL